MKAKFDWKKTLLFVIVTGGLMLITKSFLMTLGILLLLLLGDHFAQQMDRDRRDKHRDEQKENE